MSQKLTFLGKVLPDSHIKISVQDVPKVSYKINEINVSMDCTIKITDSVIETTCLLDQFHPHYLGFFYNYAYDFTCAVVNLTAFSLGANFIAIFDYIISPNGQKEAINAIDPQLAKLTKSIKIDASNKNRIPFEKVLQDPNAFQALADLMMGIRNSNLRMVGLKSCINRIQKAFIEPSSQNANSNPFEAMGKALCIDAPYLSNAFQAIENAISAEGYISGEKNSEAMKRSWEIMDRFISYKINDSKPLAPASFQKIKEQSKVH